jgi:uncharacterized protein (TIGR03067 family)
MNRRAIVALAILFMLAADKPSQQALQKKGSQQALQEDRHLMAGTWSPVALEHDGQPSPILPDERLSFGVDGKMRLESGGKLVAVAVTTIDPSKTPKAIDLEMIEGALKGEKYKGIYEITRDTLRICRSANGAKRPISFSTKGSLDTYLAVCRRASR